ncbi:MAG: hypothetical protein A3C44_03210 [Gammaproteobacteria bacterium RIFCSPHIGHO2_02_FULL_39_13]|nr:MAG: hypothetical protein A3C44_03210 [Gammaproteobacteria bacterium RIFCSPHIGHO2_02_FULL_39_13]OGT49848.1 MAG: hypothetical protein A3E53_02695 [Gammaproteobacteria bacterium RIFCSPHIGHO2_12_FULL_39_24]
MDRIHREFFRSFFAAVIAFSIEALLPRPQCMILYSVLQDLMEVGLPPTTQTHINQSGCKNLLV